MWKAVPLLTLFGLCPGLTARADDGNAIDQCWLDQDDGLRCSTPNRRSAAAQRFVWKSVLGYDIDERRQFVAKAAMAWLKHQKGRCASAEIDVQDVFNAYNGPGNDGLPINEMADPCSKQFALWLFKQENQGMPPGMGAAATTLTNQETAAAREASKKCPKAAKELIKALHEWVAAAKAFDRAKDLDGSPEDDALKEKAHSKDEATRALNACLDGTAPAWLQ
jgi:hypothetical protein